MSTSTAFAPDPTTSEWPYSGLNTDALKAGGWRPVPFRQFILKIHSRCNLACDYCYMYEMADQSWQGRPATMSAQTVAAAARRIAEHATKHDLRAIQVVLHGGEPLLVGSQALDFVASEVRTTIPDDVELTLGLQTNGALLDDAMLDVLLRHDVRVGVSLDGGRAANDRHRRYRNGQSSYDQVDKGIRKLSGDRYRHLFAGLLAVIDIQTEPIAVYEQLAHLRPPVIDFLLPHATWAVPPAGNHTDNALTPYAEWLIAAFDHWYKQGTTRIDVRLFRDLIRLALGKRAHSEIVGLEPMTFLVIETDGSIEQVDTLKAAYAGAAGTGLHVMTNDLDAAFAHPGVVARQIGAHALCQTCLSCGVRQQCGGGLYSHRYRPGSGFLNPSVYCADLMNFIEHVTGRVNDDLAKIGRR